MNTPNWMKKPRHPLIVAAEADLVLAQAEHHSRFVNARLEELERRNQQLEESHPVIDVIARGAERTDSRDP